MTEVSFAKAFVSALDSRPLKLSADHVEDPRSFPAGRPAHILPKMPKPMSKPQATSSQPAKALTVTFKSLRNPPLDISIPPQDLSTSMHALKSSLESASGIPSAKLRLLYKKKPVPDSKVLKELLTEEEIAAGLDNLELAVMVMGGANVKPPVSAEPEKKVAETEAFWGDLRGFLLQRVKDEKEGGELYDLFRASWEASKD
ncbi:uncharacterized protein DNG_08431 [Cephalotrichum gorgonifer]|uniref:Ubiquitin-like domain-containing protein n=1 Tax=Cephalotrichum gorgonifer TaxID=2041049 RepID=A0AAE8SYD6_9PEZI|nr:uncharacterized protein DNG_08431 [Cephalotrichum gorgonifer]